MIPANMNSQLPKSMTTYSAGTPAGTLLPSMDSSVHVLSINETRHSHLQRSGAATYMLPSFASSKTA